MGLPSASQGLEEISGLAPSIDAIGASEGQILSLPDSKECVEADLTVAVYDDLTFTNSMTNFENFIGSLGLPLDFISSPFSLNIHSETTSAAVIPSVESGIFDNYSPNTAGPLPFSRDLYPHDTIQSRKTSISVGSKSFKKPISTLKQAVINSIASLNM